MRMQLAMPTLTQTDLVFYRLDLRLKRAGGRHEATC